MHPGIRSPQRLNLLETSVNAVSGGGAVCANFGVQNSYIPSFGEVLAVDLSKGTRARVNVAQHACSSKWACSFLQGGVIAAT